jgi:hypothetical protein
VVGDLSPFTVILKKQSADESSALRSQKQSPKSKAADKSVRATQANKNGGEDEDFVHHHHYLKNSNFEGPTDHCEQNSIWCVLRELAD